MKRVRNTKVAIYTIITKIFSQSIELGELIPAKIDYNPRLGNIFENEFRGKNLYNHPISNAVN
jgi:hypothetical protein